MPSATAAAGPDEEPVGLRLDTIHEDALKAVCGWLLGIELARLAQTCRKVGHSHMFSSFFFSLPPALGCPMVPRGRL